MAAVIKFSETKCGLRKRFKAYTPAMANADDLRKLRAMVEGDPLESWQKSLEKAGLQRAQKEWNRTNQREPTSFF